MAANSSFSLLSYFQHCPNPEAAMTMTVVYVFIKLFLLFPLSLFVLYLGLQRWQQQRSFATTSHSDIFTYYSAAMELLFALGVVLSLCGLFFGLSKMLLLGSYMASIILPVQTTFHVLTCVERYLAVSHPIFYLKLRQSGGVQGIR
ncbi:hypothetical protein Q8A73_012653 [Channa argus]|nr:hypothetical protein Q8A73_012653 [Channa argus]